MEFDALTLSRIQFALTIMFHYLFPPLTIGLGWIMVVTEALYLKTRDPLYESSTKFWTKIFALNFAVGVASGIVMEFQFGTNWSVYSRYVGDVFGSALAAEGIFAFFLESGFLAVLVFGWDRVSEKMHFFATLMVAVGSTFSAVWIVVANSWQQTPAGYHIVETAAGPRAEITDFWAVVFNPSSMDRLMHVLIGALILGGFFVMSITAYYILRGRHLAFAKKTFPVALIFAAVVSLTQLWSGDRSANIVADHQPPKLAAFEGQFKTGPNAPLHIWGFPDVENEEVRFGIALPGMLSWLIERDVNAVVFGLDQVAPDLRPPVEVPFYAFHLMVGIGMFCIGITLLGCFFLWRGTLFEQRWLLWIFVWAVAGPYLANQLGWIAAEVGRQPWNVYGELLTGDSVSPSVPAGQIAASIVMFGLIYALLLALFLFVLNDKIHHGPEPLEAHPDHDTAASLLDTAARRIDPGSYESLSEDQEPVSGDASVDNVLEDQDADAAGSEPAADDEE